jgi:signal peptidase I
MKIVKEIIPYILIIFFVVIIRTFIVTPVIVSGQSMADTLSDGDILILKKYDKTYTRGEIIVFNYSNSKLVKRVIGLPGEYVSYKNGKLYIDGNLVDDDFSSITHDFELSDLGYNKIPEGYYFVLGDNRNKSSDSRIIGLVKESDILGSTSFSLLPFKSIK